MVKEFEEDELKRIALVTDTYVPPVKFWKLHRTPRESEHLEAALELTAALAEYLSRGEAAVEPVCRGSRGASARNRPGHHEFRCRVRYLKRHRCVPGSALAQLEADVFRDLSEVGGAVVVLIGDDDDRRKFVEKLRESGVSLRVFLITDEPAADLPPDWFALSPKAVRTAW